MLQYCQDTVAGPRQTWRSAEGKAQLEIAQIAPSAIAQLAHCTAIHCQKLVNGAVSEAHHGNACGAATMHLMQSLLF